MLDLTFWPSKDKIGQGLILLERRDLIYFVRLIVSTRVLLRTGTSWRWGLAIKTKNSRGTNEIQGRKVVQAMNYSYLDIFIILHVIHNVQAEKPWIERRFAGDRV